MSGTVRGRFTDQEKQFILKNYKTMTDKEIADALGRNTKSVTNQRAKLGCKINSTKKPKVHKGRSRSDYIASMDEKERRRFFEKEVRSCARFSAISKTFDQDELDYYVEKWVDFMIDPTIETMTSMEKDALHQLIVAEIRINRCMKEEKEDVKIAKQQGRAPISRSKEIKDCQDVILKCQNSLNVERRQRLKNQSDQAITFTNLIKDLKNPTNRLLAGREATMLKYIAEKYYNDNTDDKILSGKSSKYDVDSNFRDKPKKQLSSEFTPIVAKREKADGQKKK